MVAGVTVLLLPVPKPLLQLTLPPTHPMKLKVELWPALILFGDAEAVIVQFVTFTVTEEVQGLPPPVGVQVTV